MADAQHTREALRGSSWMYAYPPAAPQGRFYDYVCPGDPAGHDPAVKVSSVWTSQAGGNLWTCQRCHEVVMAIEFTPHEYRWARVAQYVIGEPP